MSGGGVSLKLFKKQDGTITLEAALIMPFFMLFIIFLATLIRIGIADMALYKAASETNQVIASYAYPVDLAKRGIENIVKDKIKTVVFDNDEDSIDLALDVIEWTKEGLDFFGIDVEGEFGKFIDNLSEDILQPFVEKKFEAATGNNPAFDPKKLTVTNVVAPNLIYGTGDDYLEIDVEYELDISFPFVNKTIVLQKKSYERLWTGS